jgi:hypothetical protein
MYGDKRVITFEVIEIHSRSETRKSLIWVKNQGKDEKWLITVLLSLLELLDHVSRNIGLRMVFEM